MLIKDLIKQLEELYQKGVPHIDTFGEPTIEIDVFKCIDKEKGLYQYAGIMTHSNIKFGKTPDLVYDVLTAFADEYPNPDFCKGSKIY